jgi:TetR/AcrR family transcriptional regulator, regulator of cefoperazone and chloramphenicol sensitivity
MSPSAKQSTAKRRKPSAVSAVEAGVATRADGRASRDAIVAAAVKLFADQGFKQTSTRQIAEAANANIGAIAYYFGDKLGLYRAAFCEPMGSHADQQPAFDIEGIPVEAALEMLFIELLGPLKQGELVQDCIRLHFREFVEPTGVWADEVDNGIKPHHAALVSLICRDLGLRRPDIEVQRLAFAIVGMGVHLFVCREMIVQMQPRLLSSHAAIDLATKRLTQYALAMIQSEAARRLSE